ncbi:MAG: antitoxin [Acidimicrobiales bacterium]
MGLFDKAKDLADEHADKVEDALDKVADIVDDKTGGKYTEKIDSGVEKAKGFFGNDEADAATDQEPPSKLTP